MDEKFEDAILKCSELELYLTIDGMGGYIWRMNHDMGHGRIPSHEAIDKDLARMQVDIEKAVGQTVRFGVKEPFQPESKSASPEYFKWLRCWDQWKRELSDEEWNEVNDTLRRKSESEKGLSLTEDELKKFRPKGL